MSTIPGVDRPVEQIDADVALTERGITVSCRVDHVDDVVVVRPSVSRFVDRMAVQPGDAVELFWFNAEGQRMLPARVDAVDSGGPADAPVSWHLRPTGPATHSQRRQAVRGRVEVPVTVRWGETELRGRTLDLSEAGLRGTFPGEGTPPDSGSPVDIVIGLEDGAVATRADVVRTHVDGKVWRMSIHFGGLAEREQDRIRRRVFQALREERARSVQGSPIR